MNEATLINGQLVPYIILQPGEVQRWRLLHGGINETIMLALERRVTGAAATETAIETNPKDIIELQEIAVDGITLGKIDAWGSKSPVEKDNLSKPALELEPGYRSDVLVKAPELLNGQDLEYLLLDKSSKGFQPNTTKEKRHILARVLVSNKVGIGDLKVVKKLPDEITLKEVKDAEVQATDWLRDITEEEIVERPPVEIKFAKLGYTFFNINGQQFSFDPKVSSPIKLKLGTANKWILSSDQFSHPFHIHVNPFQYTRKDPHGNNETIWKDTLMAVKEPREIRSRYQGYDGRFVLHCHILSHEDGGMMKVVEITP